MTQLSTSVVSPPIYLDYQATTPVDPRVVSVVCDCLTKNFGNPNSSDHAFGEWAADSLQRAAGLVAALVGGVEEGVVFTASATESVDIALQHAIACHSGTGPLRVSATTVEHRAVLDLLSHYQQHGKIIIRWLPVDSRARVDLDALDKALEDGTDLLCVMAANNEVGTIYPIEDISSRAALCGSKVLVDATQAAGRMRLDTTEWGITYLVLTAHKIYGPKGAGALAIHPDFMGRKRNILFAHRGTPNVPAIVGFAEAAHLRIQEMDTDEARIARQRDRLQALLTQDIASLVVNGDLEHRLAGNLHISVPGIPNDAVTSRVYQHLAIATGAACSSGSQQPSHVLRAMGLSAQVQEGALRMSVGKFTTDEEIEKAAQILVKAVHEVRAGTLVGEKPPI